MVPFLDEDLGNIPEERNAASGEYDLRIIAAEVKRTKADDRDMIVATILPESAEDVSPFNVWMVIPNDDDKSDEGGRKAKMFYRSIKRFCHLFGIPYDFEDVTADFVGKTATGYVELKQNDEGRDYNELRVPKLPRED